MLQTGASESSPTPTKRVSWDDLPTELWGQICLHMSRETLQHFRLVGNSYADIAGELLVERMQLHLDQDSLHRFHEIDSHPIISRGVRSLHFDCTVYKTQLDDIQNLKAAEAAELQVEDDCLDQKRLHHAHAGFHQKLVTQQAALELRGEISFSRFSNLGLKEVADISITSASHSDMLSHQFPQAALHPTGGYKTVQAFIDGVCRSSASPSSLKLSLSWMLVERIDLGPFKRFTAHLVDLRINFGDSARFCTPQARTLEMFKDLLACLINLQRLDVLFTGDQCEREPPEGVYDAGTLLPIHRCWPNIQSLTFTGISDHDRRLFHLFDNHTTISHLSLAHLKMSTSTCVDFLTHVRSSLRLRQITISGVLADESSRWVVSDGSRLQRLIHKWMMTPLFEQTPHDCPLSLAGSSYSDIPDTQLTSP